MLSQTCLICDRPLLKRIRSSGVFWSCRHCREEFSEQTILQVRDNSVHCFVPFEASEHHLGAPNCVNSKSGEMLTCIYDNLTEKPQILCIENIPNFGFERTVLQKQRLIFEAPAEAQLQVRSSQFCSAIQVDTIDCRTLAVSLAPSLASVTV